jgi:hypothetical protein
LIIQMGEYPKWNWSKFWIHFFCGALLGAFGGCRAWSRSSSALSTSFTPGIMYIVGGALVLGLIAGAASYTGWDER